MSNEKLIEILIMVIPMLFSLSVHEFAHAYVAYKKGDYTQERKGRMTLSPFAHIDIFGAISLLLIGFGWGKPVEVDDSNFKNRRKDMLMVSLAGPAANIILAVILTVITKILIMCEPFLGGANVMLFTMLLMQTVALNVTLAVFNMIPIPPLDGSRLLFYFLPSKYRKIEFFICDHSFVIFLLLIMTNVHSYIITPFIDIIMKILTSIL